MSAATDNILKILGVRLPGAMSSVTMAEMYSAVDDCCRRGYIWAETVSYPLVVGQLAYNVRPADSDIVSLISVTHPDFNTRMFNFDGASLITPVGPTPVQAQKPMAVQMVLAPVPSLDMSRPDTWIPDDLYVTHHEMILDATMARMTAHKSKPYTDATLAAFHGRKARNAMAAAYNARDKQKVFAASTWRYPFFA